jgi:2-oxoglutarate ferredoxin oxidoreductase subunit alpha
LIPELNLGQLSLMIRSTFLMPAIGQNKVQGKPFSVGEIVEKIDEVLNAA